MHQVSADAWPCQALSLSFRRLALAGPVPSVLQIARPGVFRRLRIRTERSRQPIRTTTFELLRRDALFDPLLDGTRRLEAIEARTAAAMAHAWQHEEAHPVTLLRPHLVEHGFVVADRVLRRDA